MPNERRAWHCLPHYGFCFAPNFYREATIRFHGLLRWEYVVLFLFDPAPWTSGTMAFPALLRYVRSEWLGYLRGLTDGTHSFLGVPAYEFAVLHVAWLFMVDRAPVGRHLCLAPVSWPRRSISAM